MTGERIADAHERGAESEEATAAALELLPTDGWKVFHDIAWPGRVYANVDHIVIGPGGVFVIDSQSWSGGIGVTGDVLCQDGRSREKAVTEAADAGLAVAELLRGVDVRDVHPVLCFVRDADLAGPAGNVMVCSTANLVQLIATRPTVLSRVAVRTAVLELGAQFRCALATRPRQPRIEGPKTITAAQKRQSTRRETAKRKARAWILRVP